MNLLKGHAHSTWAEVKEAMHRSLQEKRNMQIEHLQEHGWHRQGGVIGILFNKPLQKGQSLWWPKRPLIRPDGKLWCPPLPNLVVDSGVNIGAQRTWVTTAGGTLTPVASTTNDGVRYGGVDNNVTAVTAGTHQFDTTGSNRFLAIIEADPTYVAATGGAAGTMTADFNVTDSDTGIDHERVGTSNDLANGSWTLYSMISDFSFQPGVSLSYDLTYQFTIDYTGS